MNMKQTVEWDLAEETEVLEKKNPLQSHFIHYKSHMTLHGNEPRMPQWETASDTDPCEIRTEQNLQTTLSFLQITL
jgi:nicotinic acid phosphoribosyltransferase